MGTVLQMIGEFMPTVQFFVFVIAVVLAPFAFFGRDKEERETSSIFIICILSIYLILKILIQYA